MGGVVDPGMLAAKTAWRGNCLPLHMIPIGTLIHAVGSSGRGPAVFCRSAGTYATVIAKDEKTESVVLRLQSGEVRRVKKDACATVGVVSNPTWQHRQLGKAGRSRWLNIRPTVRGLAMNACDHPHGGGRGKSKGNRHPVSPWGVPVCICFLFPETNALTCCVNRPNPDTRLVSRSSQPQCIRRRSNLLTYCHRYHWKQEPVGRCSPRTQPRKAPHQVVNGVEGKDTVEVEGNVAGMVTEGVYLVFLYFISCVLVRRGFSKNVDYPIPIFARLASLYDIMVYRLPFFEFTMFHMKFSFFPSHLLFDVIDDGVPFFLPSLIDVMLRKFHSSICRVHLTTELHLKSHRPIDFLFLASLI